MYTAIVLLPLCGFLISGLYGRTIGIRMVNAVTIGCMVLSATFAAVLLYDVLKNGYSASVPLFEWMTVGDLSISWSLRFDTLSAIMMVVVTSVSTMVHIYAVGYMSHDESRERFMAYLSLFTFFMLMLVTADNFVQLFFGWEGVGLASYLLIGFWYEKPSANAAAMKAFIVNRVGDFGLSLGIFAVFLAFGSLNFNDVFSNVDALKDETFTFLGFEGHALTIICLLLFIGAMGKSAQLGLHTWLPDAMEGPTPVSALIHAATMVTAGVFMLARLSPMLEYAPLARDIIVLVGAATALFAATIGLTQFDIKRVIAYSTCSQLGYMIFAAGLSAYSAAIFHLFTHAFFKALLFLGAGSVIHAMSGEQDIRHMGGLRKQIPATYTMMFIGSLALAGIPPLAGFYSKDLIIEVAYMTATPIGLLAFIIGMLAAGLTAFYSWRLMFLTFYGQSRADEKVIAHIHEPPAVMIVPLILLAIGALGAGYVGYELFAGHHYLNYWQNSLFILPANDVVARVHDVPVWVPYAPLVVSVLGIYLAYIFYVRHPHLPAKTISYAKSLYQFLYNKWYVDEVYDLLFVRPARSLGQGFWQSIDVDVIDSLGPNGLAASTQRAAFSFGRLQSGYVFHYAFAMIVGLTLLATWYLYVF